MAGMRFADALVNRHTFVWKAILVAVCLCPVTDISVTVAPITAREILHNGTVPVTSSSLLGEVPQDLLKSEILGLSFVHLTANISKMVSRSVTCQLELNISSTRAS